MFLLSDVSLEKKTTTTYILDSQKINEELLREMRKEGGGERGSRKAEHTV